MYSRTVITIMALSIWVAGMFGAFWFFEAQYLRPVQRPAGAAIANPDTNPIPAVRELATDSGTVVLNRPGPIRLLNFWNPDCPCTRYMEPYVKDLVRKYAPLGVEFVTIIEDTSPTGSAQNDLRRWAGRGFDPMPVICDKGCEIAREFGVWAAPGAVIIDSSGRVCFVGSYNAARYCGNPDTAWAAQALASVERGQRPKLTKTPFFGCTVLGKVLACPRASAP